MIATASATPSTTDSSVSHVERLRWRICLRTSWKRFMEIDDETECESMTKSNDEVASSFVIRI